jgi:hypothetical protein
MLVASSLIFAASNVTEQGTIKKEDNSIKLDKSKSDKTKGFIQGLKQTFPVMANFIEEYYQIKTCKEDYYNYVSVDEIRDFAANGVNFGVLMGLKTFSDSKEGIENNKYLQVMNNYRFINCGEGKYFDKGLKGKK